jgi:zinc transport system permease protein
MSILDFEFMRLALAAGAIVGLVAPAIGFFLVQRRLTLIGDGIGHIAFAGVAAGYLIGISPVWTALGFSVTGAIAIEWMRYRKRAAGDQVLALFFYVGIAAGVVMISSAGALNANLFTFLFGSILTVTQHDLVVIGVLGVASLVVVGALYRSFVAVAVDEEGARVGGLPVGLLNVTLAALAGVAIGISMRIVGILLIAALMVLPVIAASRVAWSVSSTMILSMVLGIAAALSGLVISYYADLAPGGAIVLVAAGMVVAATVAPRRA